MTADLSGISLRMAGRAGADGLRLARQVPALLAAVDQHAAEVREALAAEAQAAGGHTAGARTVGAQAAGGGAPAVSALLSYASGFVEAAVGRGWSPRPGGAADWESLRLAAVCQLISQGQPPARLTSRS